MAEQHAPTRPRSPTPSPVSKPKARPWYASLRSNTAAAVIIFVVTPLILIGIGAPMVVPGYRVLAFRSFLDLTLCLLPATMWYLFIITRRASLLNDFVTSLNRLGLLQPMEYEDGDGPARQRRVDAYLQKFEASYGPLSKDVRRSILDGTFNPGAPEERSTRASGRPADVIAASTTIPIILATVLTALGWLVTLPPYRGTEPLEIVEQPFTYAFLGAYFFSLQMLFRRYVRKDLRGSAYVAVAMRIILAVIGTGVAEEAVQLLNPAVSDRSLLVVGFTIGVFPKVAWQIFQTAFRQVTGLVVKGLRTDSPLSALDGLTVWHEARLEEEDIENVPNMATTDIVELFLNTRVPPTASSTGSTRPSSTPTSAQPGTRRTAASSSSRRPADGSCAASGSGRRRRWSSCRFGIRPPGGSWSPESSIPTRWPWCRKPSSRTTTSRWSAAGAASPPPASTPPTGASRCCWGTATSCRR
jgi:hypothetical protein